MNATEKKNLFKKVQDWFNDKGVPAVVVEKFEELLLVDGTTKITVEPDLAVGSAIALYAEDGTPVPAPAGQYELEDGRVIVVEMDGVISAINEPVAEEELEEEGKGKPAEPSAESAKVKELIERVETVSKYGEALKSEFKKENDFLKGENDALKTQVFELEKFVKEVLETLLSEPAQEPVVKKHNPFRSEEKPNIFLNRKTK